MLDILADIYFFSHIFGTDGVGEYGGDGVGWVLEEVR